MRRIEPVQAVLAATLLTLFGCHPDGSGVAPIAAAPTESVRVRELAAADVDMFLAVRARALTRIENGVAEVESGNGSLLEDVIELADAEKEAVSGLGFDWSHYRFVREEIARLQSAQREREDAELLSVELTRARDDLVAQLRIARDAAARQFLEAQVASLDRQLEGLAGETEVSDADARGRELIERVRAELAVQQGRQERIQKRLRELVQRERAGGAPPATPAD